MENVLFFKKALLAYVVYGALPPLAQIVNHAAFGWISATMIVVMMLITVLPEIACMASKPFWTWIKKGIEDGDGKLHAIDLGEFIGYYGTFLVLRLFVFAFLFVMMGTWNPPLEILYSPLAFVASGGILTYIKGNKKG